MNIYISHAGDYDYEAALYAPIRHSELAGHHTFFLPHESHNVHVAARDVLQRTDLMVAEVSRPSTGQGIELGLAVAAGVPVVCLYRKGATPSSALRFITSRIEAYADGQDFLTKLKVAVEATSK